MYAFSAFLHVCLFIPSMHIYLLYSLFGKSCYHDGQSEDRLLKGHRTCMQHFSTHGSKLIQLSHQLQYTCDGKTEAQREKELYLFVLTCSRAIAKRQSEGEKLMLL